MKLNLSARFLMLALLCGSCVLNTPKEELEYNGMNTLQISNVDDLISFYQYADDRIPLITGTLQCIIVEKDDNTIFG